MKNFFLNAATLSAALAVACCSPVLSDDCPVESDGRVNVVFNAVPRVKSILGGNEIETRITTVHLAAYDQKTALLDDFYYGPAENASLKLCIGKKYAIYALSNIPSRDEVEFPINEGSVSGLSYRIPSYESMSSAGLPGVYMERDVSFSKSTHKDIELTRLLSRITLRINHENLTGGDGNLFTNSHLHVRGANSLLLPFDADKSRARSQSDILQSSDYDSDMGDSSSGEVFTFYVPENVQGVLLPGNSDQSLKSQENLEKVCPSSVGLLTYMEYVGTVLSGASGSGFSGDVTYRFYLGEDATGDFSIVRNKDYRIDLSFDAGNLFTPCWKVTPDLEDHREISLSKNGVALTSANTLVVRPSHPATFTLDVKNGGGGSVADSGLLDEGETIPDLGRTYWCSNIAGRTGASLLSTLNSDGLNVSFNESTGAFSITVTDPSSFKAGKTYDLKFNLVPDNGSSAGVRLLAMDDVKLSWDAPVSEWYLAQRRTATIQNAYSSYDLSVSDSKVSCSDPTDDNSFNMLAVNTYKLSSKQSVTLSFIPRDTMNDDPLSLKTRIKIPLPMYSGNADGEITLTMDGEAVETGFNYYTEDGGEILPAESFDADEFESHFGYTMDYMGFYTWCQVPDYLSPSGYPDSEMSLVKLSSGMLDIRDFIKYKADYALGELYFTPTRSELYDEGQYPSLYVIVVNPFPKYDSSKALIGSVNISGMTFTGTISLPFSLNADYRQCSAAWDNTSYRGSFNPDISVGDNCILIHVDSSDKSDFEEIYDDSRVFTLTLTNKNSLETFQWQYTVHFY